MSTGKIPNITRAIDPNQCAAMRCKNAPTTYVSGAHWHLHAGVNVPLCDTHKVPLLMRDATVVQSLVDTEGESVDPQEEEKKNPVPSDAGGAARALVAATTEEANESLNLVEQLSADTQEDLEFISELLIDVKKKLNQLLEVEASITHPMKVLLDGARDLFRPAKNKLALLEAILKGKIAHAKAVEASNNARALAEVAEAHRTGDTAAAAAAISQVRHQSNVEGVATRVAWTWEIEDHEAVPREYLIVNDKMLNSLCKGSEMPQGIPGIKFVQKNIVIVRGAGAQA